MAVVGDYSLTHVHVTLDLCVFRYGHVRGWSSRGPHDSRTGHGGRVLPGQTQCSLLTKTAPEG